jgi:hypothetical protein
MMVIVGAANLAILLLALAVKRYASPRYGVRTGRWQA